MPANSFHLGHSSNSADLRESLKRLGFEPRLPKDDDVRETQFSIKHPQSELVELVVHIDVANVFYKDEAYNSASIFTLVKGLPLNISNHPLNINVGLSEVHDTAIFHNIVEGVAVRFRGLNVDDEVLSWYKQSYIIPAR
jgi:hypothetical protein